MTTTETSGICGRVRPFTDARCERPPGHPGQHQDRRKVRWGGKTQLSTRPPVKPLPAGKQLAPYRPPAAPLASKFTDIPGQMAMDLFSDDPDALVEP